MAHAEVYEFHVYPEFSDITSPRDPPKLGCETPAHCASCGRDRLKSLERHMHEQLCEREGAWREDTSLLSTYYEMTDEDHDKLMFLLLLRECDRTGRGTWMRAPEEWANLETYFARAACSRDPNTVGWLWHACRGTDTYPEDVNGQKAYGFFVDGDSDSDDESLCGDECLCGKCESVPCRCYSVDCTLIAGESDGYCAWCYFWTKPDPEIPALVVSMTEGIKCEMTRDGREQPEHLTEVLDLLRALEVLVEKHSDDRDLARSGLFQLLFEWCFRLAAPDEPAIYGSFLTHNLNHGTNSALTQHDVIHPLSTLLTLVECCHCSSSNWSACSTMGEYSGCNFRMDDGIEILVQCDGISALCEIVELLSDRTAAGTLSQVKWMALAAIELLGQLLTHGTPSDLSKRVRRFVERDGPRSILTIANGLQQDLERQTFEEHHVSFRRSIEKILYSLRKNYAVWKATMKANQPTLHARLETTTNNDILGTILSMEKEGSIGDRLGQEYRLLLTEESKKLNLAVQVTR